MKYQWVEKGSGSPGLRLWNTMGGDEAGDEGQREGLGTEHGGIPERARSSDHTRPEPTRSAERACREWLAFGLPPPTPLRGTERSVPFSWQSPGRELTPRPVRRTLRSQGQIPCISKGDGRHAKDQETQNVQASDHQQAPRRRRLGLERSIQLIRLRSRPPRQGAGTAREGRAWPACGPGRLTARGRNRPSSCARTI